MESDSEYIKQTTEAILDNPDFDANQEPITYHDFHRWKLLNMVTILDYLLQSEFYQEILDCDWQSKDFLENKKLSSRYLSIGEALHHLIDLEVTEDIIIPDNVKPFCDKLKTYFDDKHWNEDRKQFWDNYPKKKRK